MSAWPRASRPRKPDARAAQPAAAAVCGGTQLRRITMMRVIGATRLYSYRLNSYKPNAFKRSAGICRISVTPPRAAAGKPCVVSRTSRVGAR